MLTLDVVSVSETPKFFLSGCVPYIVFDGSSVGVEDQGMYLDTQSGCRETGFV